jgi:hypothetical protein
VIKQTLEKNKTSVAIKSMRQIKSGGLAINCDTTEDTNKLIESIEQTTSDFEAFRPRLKNPKIVIYNVDEEISN